MYSILGPGMENVAKLNTFRRKIILELDLRNKLQKRCVSDLKVWLKSQNEVETNQLEFTLRKPILSPTENILAKAHDTCTKFMFGTENWYKT